MSESGQERTEEATPRRRQQARKKGTVAKSQDLVGAIIVMALVALLPPTLSNLGNQFMLSFTNGLRNMPDNAQPATLGAHCASIIQGPLLAFLPLVGIIMVSGVAANFAQVGFVLSTESLTPNLNKINPFNGFKRIFSMTATMEGAKALVKSCLFGYMAWLAIQSHWDQLIGLAWTSPQSSIAVVGSLLHRILIQVGVSWLVLASLDYFFQRKQVEKQLKMTKEEIKQEMKEMEQSPELRQAMAQRRRQLSKGRMMEAVKTADVIVTNPTHFSVAIKYDPDKMHAPQVVAKGQDLIALKIREIAKENRVPIVPNPPLARQLYKKCEIGDTVPRDLFQAVAEVLAYVYRTIKNIR